MKSLLCFLSFYLWDIDRIPAIRNCTADYLEIVTQQMEKDLALSGLTYNLSSCDPENLIKELAELLKHTDMSTTKNILYGVDVVTDILGSEKNYDLISEKLWNRVLQKVWFRLNCTASSNTVKTENK